MNSWYRVRAKSTGAEVAIYDEIGAYGVSAKGFLSELGALPDGTPIDLRLNSPGGSVFDAVAIHNALIRHEGTITVWIDGIAASAASYIAMAGDEIVMPENAFLMIHDPSGLVMGTADDMRSMAEALDKVKGSLVQGYAAKSGRPAEEIAALMAKETWFDAGDALAQGFADRLVEPVRIAAHFDIHRFRNAPTELMDGASEPSPPWDGASPPNETEVGPTENADDSRAHDIDAEVAGAGEEAADNSVDRGSTAVAADTDAATLEGHVAAVNMPSEVADAGEADAGHPLPDTGPGARLADSGRPPPDPLAIRAEAIGHARAVVDLCRLAGQPQMAGRFLEQEASLDEVRTALLAAKAEAEPEIAAHHPQPGRSSAARPWGEIVARTFRLKG
ncbi:head maturation protease, ClpP-related [Amaricoccus macauensis]|uniref:head maturation protease, ClpP-related n=1 Tax=Amaricoccus macauensis TaxID=57001 RepID=UPI003C7DBFEB